MQDQSCQFSLRSCEKKLFGRFWQKAVPLLINNLAWGIGFSMYAVIMGHLESAANGIANILKLPVIIVGKPSWCRPSAGSKRGRLNLEELYQIILSKNGDLTPTARGYL